MTDSAPQASHTAWRSDLEREGTCDCCLSSEKPVVTFADEYATTSCEDCWRMYVEEGERDRDPAN